MVNLTGLTKYPDIELHFLQAGTVARLHRKMLIHPRASLNQCPHSDRAQQRVVPRRQTRTRYRFFKRATLDPEPIPPPGHTFKRVTNHHLHKYQPLMSPSCSAGDRPDMDQVVRDGEGHRVERIHHCQWSISSAVVRPYRRSFPSHEIRIVIKTER